MWTEFHFLRPWWLTLLLPAAVLVWQIVRRETESSAWQGVISPHLLRHLVVGQEQQSRVRPVTLLAVLWILGIVALAGPTLERQPAPFADDQIAIAIIVECTETMNSTDIQPSRLERAGQKVSDFLAKRPDVQAALFAYAGSAHRVMPFTNDAGILSSFASELGSEIMPIRGDAAAAAIALANAELRELGKPGAIFLLTDGIDPGQAAQAIEAGSAPVHILAVGRAIDIPALAAASSSLGGTLTLVTPDDRDVMLLAEQIESNLQAAPSEGGGERWKDLGYWGALLMLIPAAFWFRRGWTVRHA